MRLREFRLDGFTQHTHTVVTFRDDQPNLILGPNESGKSHLMRGLTATLFGRSARQAEPYRPWQGEPRMRGRLRLAVDGDEIEIDRRILEERVTVWVNGDQVYDGRGRVDLDMPEDQAYRRLLSEWVGFADAGVFERTVFVGQDLLQDDQLEAIATRIKQIISGSSETSYDAAISDLDKTLDDLIKRPGKRVDRQRERLRAQIDDLQARHREAARIQARAGKLRDEETTHRSALDEARREQRTLHGIVQHAGTLADLRGEEERWRDRWTELDQQIERMDAIQRQRDEQEARVRALAVPEDPDPDQVRRLGAEIDGIERQIADLDAQLERERQREAPQTVRTPGRQRPEGSRRGALLGAGVAVTSGFLALGVVVHPAFYAGMVAGLVFLALGLMQRSTPPAGGQVTIPGNVPRSEAVEALERQIAERRRTLAGLTAGRDRLLTQACLPDLDTLYQRLRQHREAAIRLESTQTVDETERQRREDDRSRARQETGIARDRIDRLLQEHPGLDGVTPEQLQDYRRRLEAAQHAEREADGALYRLQIEREELAKGSDDAESLRLEIDEIETEIDRVERLAVAHELAIAVLEESVRDFQVNALDPVGDDATRHFATITDGRYSAVRLDKDTMIPTVSTGDVERVDHSRLSRGARDQLYLSIRVALVDALSGGRALPLALDDPAVNFDMERLAATAELLREIATSRQVLILSQDERWTKWFEPVARLPRVAGD